MHTPFLFTLFLFLGFSLAGQPQNLSQGTVFDGEPYLAINPDNPQHLVVAWMGWENIADLLKIKTKTSFDGGRSWSETVALPHVTSGFSSADPSIAFNHQGEVFISYIDFTGTTPPVTGGVYLCRSADGGLSWDSPQAVITTDFDGDKWPIDRPWMVIDRSEGPHQGNIYVTSMNLNRTMPSFNPYLSTSTDNGNTFTSRYLDAPGWLAGNLNPLPVCTPTVTSNGVFCGVYPSFSLVQSFFPQAFLVTSTDGGNTIAHQLVERITDNIIAGDFGDAKKGPLLLADPTDPDHLVFISLRAIHGDLDVFINESFDLGASWSSPLRVNDDPIGNNRMQDMLWGDFDDDGDLIISWRDRRNGADSTFQTASDVWAAYRPAGQQSFEANFSLTNQDVAFDDVLERAGNDFMNIQLQNDTLHATWGDARDGRLNIWFRQLTVTGEVVSNRQIASETTPNLSIYPNPAKTFLQIQSQDIHRVTLRDQAGRMHFAQAYASGTADITLSLKQLPTGVYLLEVVTAQGRYVEQVLVNR